jgi:protein involved in polysaccharide export with SLBB domain
MKNDRQYYFSFIFLCVISIQLSILAQTATPTPEVNSVNVPLEDQKSERELIHSGDLIDVDVVGSTEYDWRGTLTPEGFLSGINFTGNPIYALCQTEESVALTIITSYGKILREPKVVVKILDRSNRPVSVLYGAVKKNQRFQIKRPVWLNELIIVSGGFTDKVSGEIQILRPPNINCEKETSKPLESPAASVEKTEKITQANRTDETRYINIKISDLLSGKKEANPQILSGDVITVLEAKPVYVIGGVGTPKQIPLRTQITLSRAIDSAGGLTKGADAKKIIIFRKIGETKIIEADLDKIKANQAEDIILQAFDIVEVTQTGREKRKFPPIINVNDLSGKVAGNLPLRIVD